METLQKELFGAQVSNKSSLDHKNMPLVGLQSVTKQHRGRTLQSNLCGTGKSLMTSLLEFLPGIELGSRQSRM